MENASKALVMAGAILITIMVLGMFIFFFAQLKEFPEQQDEAKKLAQVSKFNQEYESYYKKKMYGTDVVTIMNKVITNNKKYADSITGRYNIEKDNYFIDVEITLLKDVISYATQYKEVSESNGLIDNIPYDKGTIKGYVNGNKKNEKTFILGTKLKKGKINLLTKDNFQYFSNTSLEKFFSDGETYKIQLTSGENKADKFDEFNYTMVYSGFTEFKRKYFECTGIEYDVETARVSKISFKEIVNE